MDTAFSPPVIDEEPKPVVPEPAPAPVPAPEPVPEVKETAAPKETTPVVDEVPKEAPKTIEADSSRPKKKTTTVTIKKSPTQDLGIDVDYGDRKTLRVVRVKPGLVQDWNIANSSIEVRQDDRIIAVNGAGGTVENIISEIKKSDVLNLTVQRHDELLITVVKDSAEQALSLDIDNATVRVVLIKDGSPFLKYNSGLKEEHLDFKVLTDDKIVEVNGKVGPENVLEELRTVQVLNMTIMRETK